MRRRELAAAAFLLAGIAPSSSGQTELYRVDGTAVSSSFGSALAPAGDVDQDGIPDFLAGAPASGNGRAALHSGVDGSLVWEWFGAASNDLFGSAVAGAGDATADAIPDLLVGAIGATDPASGRITGAVTLYSGSDGTPVHTWYGNYGKEEFGVAVANLGDVDGDGVDDHLVGAPGASYVRMAGGAAYLFSGATGSFIDRVSGPGAGNNLGAGVAALGDVDHDGAGDFAVGLPFRDVSGLVDCGAVWVYSGATRLRLFAVSGDQSALNLGYAIAGGADADGDGTNDFVIGAPKWSGAFAGQGVVRLCSGVDGAVLWERFGTGVDDQFGRAVALADADGDGDVEVLVTAGGPGTLHNRVERCAASDGTVLYTWLAPQLDDGLGEALAVLGDVSGDGRSDYALGASRGDDGSSTYAGSVHVDRGSDLWLNADPKAVAAGATLTTTVRVGLVSNAVLRVVVDLNGTPLFVSLPPLITFDASGTALWQEMIPTGLSGLIVTLRAYAIAASGKLIDTDDETITLL